MKGDKTEKQLLKEIKGLRNRLEELELAEAEKVQAGHQISDVINAAPDVIHVISPDMRIINKNSASGKLFPHVKEGDHCYKALHGRDEACPHCGVTKVFKDGKREAHESTIKLPDGNQVTVYSTSSPMFDEEGNITAVVEILHDITRRKKAEDELRLFSQAVEKAADAINIMDQEGKFVFVNPEFCRMHGYTAKELIGESFLITVPEEDRDIAARYFKDVIAEHGGSTESNEYEGKSLRKDGSTIEVHGKWSYTYKDGKVSGTMAILRDFTERKMTEQRIRDIINAAPDVIHVISPDMRIVNRNAESKKLFPHIKDGDHCYAALHGRDEACPHCGVTKVFKDGKREAHESTIKLPDGGRIIVHSTSSPIFDENGGVAAVVEILHDITRRKKAEEGLKLLSQAVEEAADAINIMDRDGKFVFVNPEFCRMHGYTAKELIGESFLITVPEEDREAATEYFRAVINEHKGAETSNEYEGKSLRKDGSTVEVHGAWSYVYKDGKVNGTMAVLRDFTERKLAEQRIRDIINGAPDIIHVISPDMKITHKNTASGKVFTHVKEGDHCYAALHGRDEACPHCGVTKVFKSGEKEAHESTIKLPDGGRIIVHSTSAPIFDEKGGVAAVVEVLHDVTQLKEAEAEIKKYAKELEEANRLKDLFTDIIRHDLLNPVDVIKNLTEMLTEEEKYKDSKDLQMILSSAKKTEEMIQNASKYAKLEDITELELEELELGKIVRDVISDFRPFLEMKNMKVDYSAEGEYPVKCINMIEDVFANLLSNAIKYTPAETTIKVAIADKENSWLISFADQGEGVPDKYKESLFDRFTRRKKEGVKGSGLGLAIAQRIVDLHNGRIWIEDSPEGGSIFCVSLPK